MKPYRVFLSYSQGDSNSVEEVIQILKGLDLKPTSDKDIPHGQDFRIAIRDLISQSHIFMPFLTENSKENHWVHQETAYALALNIPVLPLAVGALPDVMIAHLQAIKIKKDLSDLEDQVNKVDFEQVVISPPQMSEKMIEIAEFPEERTKMLVENIERVKKFGKQTWKKQGKSPWMIRQRAALSSFSIPNKDIKDGIWKRYDGKSPRSEYYHDLIRREREGLECLSRLYGLRLIIAPSFKFDPKKRGIDATIVRLEELSNFLNEIPDNKVEIVTSIQAEEGNLTIVGNWFFAESKVPRLHGFHQTMFNWHAPGVLRKIRDFDIVFEKLYKKSGTSRRNAIKNLDERISNLNIEKEKTEKNGGRPERE